MELITAKHLGQLQRGRTRHLGTAKVGPLKQRPRFTASAENAALVETPVSTVIIKKYGNRRLYDTSASRYINLDDLAALIREGKDVKVVDARTGQDLTRVTLTQVITEDAKGKPTGLPLELLRQLIVASDEVRQEFIMWYLKSALDTYQKVQDAVQNRLGEVRAAILSPVEAMTKFLGATAPAPPSTAEAEVDALRKRIAELEERLENEVLGKPRRRKKT